MQCRPEPTATGTTTPPRPTTTRGGCTASTPRTTRRSGSGGPGTASGDPGLALRRTRRRKPWPLLLIASAHGWVKQGSRRGSRRTQIRRRPPVRVAQPTRTCGWPGAPATMALLAQNRRTTIGGGDLHTVSSTVLSYLARNTCRASGIFKDSPGVWWRVLWYAY